MPLHADSLLLCGAAPDVVDAIFADNAAVIFDTHHRHLVKCWLNKHFVTTGQHKACLAAFEDRLCSYVDEAISVGSDADSKWHLRFVNGFQLLSECDASVRCLLESNRSVQQISTYFGFAINKFMLDTSAKMSSGLVYLEAKLLLKLVQIFARIYGKIPVKNRPHPLPATLIANLWTLSANDVFELDVRQASINLIIQLDPSPCYAEFSRHAFGLVEAMVPSERQQSAKMCLQVLGTGAFCSQLSVDQLGEEYGDRALLLILLEEIAACCSSRMSTSFAIAFYRSLLSWTKAAVSTCSLGGSESFWNRINVKPVFRLFVHLIESGWDSHAEVVRDLVSEVFESLLTLLKHTTSLSDQQDTFLDELICTLLKTDWQSRLKYRPLSQIAELFGPDILMANAAKIGINIPEKISTAFNDRAIAPHAATFIATLAKWSVGHTTTLFHEESFIEEFLLGVVKAARNDGGVTRHFVSFLVPKLLKARGKRFVSLIVHRASSIGEQPLMMADAEFLILFSVCRSARASALYELAEQEDTANMALLLNEALNHSNIYIRLEAFGFLCENARIGQPLLAWELDTIERFVVAAFKVDSSDFRQAYASLFRKLLTRLRDGGNGAERLQTGSLLARDYIAFLDRIIGLSLESLTFIGSAFARRSTALTLLAMIAKIFPDSGPDSVRWFAFDKNCFENRAPAAVHILIRALMRDTYEDNKKVAFDLLTLWWQHHENSADHLILNEAMRMAQSTHPQDGVTAGYLFKLLCTRHLEGEKIIEFISGSLLESLKDQLEVAKVDLAKAATTRPIYPTILCIRYVITEFRDRLLKAPKVFRNFALKLIETLTAVADTVTPVITHQSPEGMQPEIEGGEEGNEDAEIDDPLGLLPEFLTVCCWRSIKEVSLTLSLLVDISVDKEPMVLLEVKEVTEIGNFFSEMLLKARHRGAFEIAYAGFDHICSRLWRCQSTDLNSLPSFWLKPLLACFESTGDNVTLSSTRRSAGLPFYFQAVVGNEPRLTRSVSVSLLETVLALLIARAQQTGGDDVVKVHALNILRALVRDSRLEQAVTPFLGEVFIAAMMALSSKQWMLRNSGTLLFSALMNRVFGVHRDKFSPAKKNTMTGRLFFALYPNLFQFLLNFFSTDYTLLTENTTSSVAVTFLSLFEHLYPSPFDVNETSSASDGEKRDETDNNIVRAPSSPHVNVFAFIPALISMLGHRSVRVRLMASRSIRNFVTVDSLAVLLDTIIARYNDVKFWDANFVDGCLILLRKLVAMFATDVEALQLIYEVTLAFAESIKGVNNCHVTASLLHLLLKLVEEFPSQGFTDADKLIQFTSELANEVIDSARKSSDATGLTNFPSTLLIRASQCAVLCLSRGKATEKINSAITNYLVHPNKFVRSTVADCLNELYSREFINKEEGHSGLMAPLFEDSLGKDEEYVAVRFGDVPLARHVENQQLVTIIWKQIDAISIDQNEFELSKLLTLFSLCLLTLDCGQKVDRSIAEAAFDKIMKIMASFGHFSELALPSNRALAAVAPYLNRNAQEKVVDVLSKMVSGTDDYAKFRIAIFGLSRLPSPCVLSNDASCDVMLMLLSSSEPEIRILASWYVTRFLCRQYGKTFEYRSLHSGQALLVFSSLVASSRPFESAVRWLLSAATSPKRTLTTEGENLQLVFEAEETNPFSEDRLVSNCSVLLLSILMNGLDETLMTIFPRLHLPAPLVRCLECFFPKVHERDSNKNQTFWQVAKSVLLLDDDLPVVDGRDKLAEIIFDSAFEATADKKRNNALQPASYVMPHSDVVYQRLLISKLLDADLFTAKLAKTVVEKEKFTTGFDFDAFIAGDSTELATLIVC